MEARPTAHEITAYVPLDPMFGHAPMIRSLAQDQDVFAMQFERYEAVPCAIAEEPALSPAEGIVAARMKKKGEKA